MKKIELLHTNQGNTLVSIMMAMLIGSGVALAMAQHLKNLSSGEQYMRFATEVDLAHSEIRQILASDEACRNTFNGVILTPALNQNVASIRNALGGVAFNTTDSYGQNTFRISSFVVNQYEDETFPQGHLLLTLLFQKNGEQSGGPAQINRSIAIRTQKTTGNSLVGCTSFHEDQSEIWNTGRNPNNQVFTAIGVDEFVGIGTDDPQVKLDVKGGYIRGQFDCRVTPVQTAHAGIVISCESDEIIWSAGGRCERTQQTGATDGFIHAARRLTLRSMAMDCYQADGVGDSLARAWGVCCKL